MQENPLPSAFSHLLFFKTDVNINKLWFFLIIISRKSSPFIHAWYKSFGDVGKQQEKLALEVGFSRARHYEIAGGLMGVLVATH